MICRKVCEVCPEFKEELVPMCVRNGGVCYEMFGCGLAKAYSLPFDGTPPDGTKTIKVKRPDKVVVHSYGERKDNETD